MEILHLQELGDTKSFVTTAVWVFILSLTIICMYLLMLYPCIKFKEIGQLVMEILHFKDLGNAESVVTNAVVLVLGGCQI